MNRIVKYLPVLLLVAINVAMSYAGCYDQTFNAGLKAYNSGKYSYARQCFVAAKDCPDAPANGKSVCNSWISTIDRLTTPAPTPQPAPQPQPDNSEKLYASALDKGEQLYDNEQYSEAKSHFQTMLSKYSKHKENINQWIKRCDKMLARQQAQTPAPTPTIERPTTVRIDTRESVDLGLSVKWATCNIGATSPQEYGDYFSWGEISPKSSYTAANYIGIDSSIMDISGDRRYDAATANWGSDWRMPTYKECAELHNKCDWKWIDYNGVKGYLVTGPNGNQIFLPAGGTKGENPLAAGVYGIYSSSERNPDNAGKHKGLGFLKSKVYTFNGGECFNGRNIRPVNCENEQGVTITCRGQVVFEDGEPAIGAAIENIAFGGGVATDMDGNFTMNVVAGTLLKIYYVDCETVYVNARRDMGVITLKER